MKILRSLHHISIYSWLLLVAMFCQNALAQLPDEAFNPNANGAVNTLVVQPDGKLLVAGAFTQIAGQSAQRITRLLVNGQADSTFPPIVVNGEVFAIGLQADGKILIGGAFTEVGTIARNRIARLNANGTLDSSFNPGSGANASVRAIAVQANGGVVLGGSFTEINGIVRNRVARLNANGTLDTVFDPGLGANAVVRALALQADGRVLVGGGFSSVAGVLRSRIARLDTNGLLDSSFDPGAGANSAVFSLALQADGQILLGGLFNNVGGAARSGIARLNANGSLDSSFAPGTGADDQVAVIVQQADGRILLGGIFTSFDGTARGRLARLSTSGALEIAFSPGVGTNDSVLAIAVQDDGRVLLGGDFTSFNGIARNRMTRLNPNGGLDVGFNAGSGANAVVRAIAVQADGRVLLGGEFTSINGTVRTRVARLNISGSLDTTFDPGSGANDDVFALAIQPDGRVLVGGGFDSFNGSARDGIARLNADGSLDSGFSVSSVGNVISGIAVQPDGRILLNRSPRVVRLNADGSSDSSFAPGTLPGLSVNTFALQADGKVVLGGRFSGRIARLQADGTLDTSFNPSAQANDEVKAIALQANGRILLGGRFTLINGVARNGIARLNADGSLDTEFDPGTGANGIVNAFALQANGQILLVGDFTEINNTRRNNVARLNANGSLDTSFDAGEATIEQISAVALQPDGRVLLGGNFLTINGSPSNRIDRLSTAQAALQSLSLEGLDVRWLRGASSPELVVPPTLALSLTGNANSFVSLGTMSRIAGGWQLSVPSLPPGQNFFVRAEGTLISGERDGSSGRVQSTAQLFSPDSRDALFANGFE